MALVRKLSRLLMLLGAVAFVTATAWWYQFFAQMLGENVKLASECFYFSTETCATVSTVEVFFDVPAYSPYMLYLAAGLFAAGLIIGALARDG